MNTREPPGWSSWDPDTVAYAVSDDPPLDFIIDRQPDGTFGLTVTDPVAEVSEVTVHATVEAAQQAAARLLGGSALDWSPP